MRADGTAPQADAQPGFDGSRPWSPDGRQDPLPQPALGEGRRLVMNADGSGQRSGGPGARRGRLVAGRQEDRVRHNRDGNGEIYVMNADGSGQKNLVAGPSTQEWSPEWSPDGRTIAFVTDRDGNAEIYAMNADGSGPRNLTRSPGNDGGIGGAAGVAGRRTEADRVRKHARHARRRQPRAVRHERGRKQRQAAHARCRRRRRSRPGRPTDARSRSVASPRRHAGRSSS